MELEYFMRIALEEARSAFQAGEVPIGCIIVDKDGKIVGRGRNRCAEESNSMRHAEMLAIEEACQNIGDWRLSECTLFVTIEPCPMCAGAIVITRVGTVVYGAKNPKAGCAGSIFNILEEPRLNHRCIVTGGVLAEECGGLMSEFFRTRLRVPKSTGEQN